MKLKDAQTTMRQSMLKKYSIIATIFISILALNLILKLKKFSFINIYVTCSCILMVLILIAVFYLIQDKLNRNYAYLKEKGEKIIGNVVGVGKVDDGTYRNNYYIIVEYNNIVKRIQFVESNDAYSVLEMLLDPYPVKRLKKIPIDLYVQKNKVYADLESVDLSKVEGYEEALKLVEDMKDDMNTKHK